MWLASFLLEILMRQFINWFRSVFLTSQPVFVIETELKRLGLLSYPESAAYKLLARLQANPTEHIDPEEAHVDEALRVLLKEGVVHYNRDGTVSLGFMYRPNSFWDSF